MLSLGKFDSFALAEFLSEFFLRSIFIESLLSVVDDEAGDFAKDLSVDDVHFYLDYIDGNFYWKNPTSRRVKNGGLAQVSGHRYLHLSINKKNYGLVYSIKQGVLKAKNDFILFIPGDNEHSFQGLVPLFQRFSEYKITIPYIINKNARSRFRRILSKIYTFILNFSFNKNIPYFNGLVLYEKKIVQQVQKKITNFSFSYLAETLIRCLERCNNYQIVGYKIRNQKNRSSNSLKLRNIFYSLYFIFKLRINFLIK